MAAGNFDPSVKFTLLEEGGYSDDLSDTGGPTNLGITQATLSHWNGAWASRADVQALTPETAMAIYHSLYWRAVHADAMPGGVDLMLFDAGVNTGVGRAIRQLQVAVGTVVDGVIGPKTMDAVQMFGPTLVDSLRQIQGKYYYGLAQFPLYGAGWMARLGRRYKLALELANA